MLHINKKRAFTMIELVFVIVVLGILAAIAIPKFAATRTDAQVAKGRSDVSAIRSSIINERQSRLLTGDRTFIKAGTDAGELDDGGLFGGVLTYSITDKDENGHWHNTSRASDGSEAKYNYKFGGNSVEFTYTQSDGKFDCNHTISACKTLTE
jgi:general secretion pathway protein G